MTAEYVCLRPGLPPELDVLTLEELQHHYCVHLHDFVLDDNLGAAYLNRFVKAQDLQSHPGATRCFVHLMRKIVQLLPFTPDVHALYAQLFNAQEHKAKAAVLAKQAASKPFLQRIQLLKDQDGQQAIHDLLRRELQRDGGTIAIAEMLLELCLESDFLLDAWFESFTPHPLLKNDWNAHAAFLAAQHGRPELAIRLWEAAQGPDFTCGENTLNFVGVSYAACGDSAKARELYTRSLAMDPTQLPIRLLIDEIDSPFAVNAGALRENPVPILIYSCNKAALLEQTLDSVCRSDIGDSEIIVLLNGCTDDSRAVVEKAQQAYGARAIECIAMPVNMGAPAARNYLLHHVRNTREFTCLAYLDDDVTLPPHWLQALVTALEEDPEIGAVGCRIRSPEDGLQQYLYRDVSIARPGTFRLGLSTLFNRREIGMYDVRRDADSVMGCCHLIRKECFDDVPGFDIQFSPSQLDDVAFHLDLVLHGWKVRYLGQLECMHHRATSFKGSEDKINGSAQGNEMKLYFRFHDQFDAFNQRLRANTARFMKALV